MHHTLRKNVPHTSRCMLCPGQDSDEYECERQRRGQQLHWALEPIPESPLTLRATTELRRRGAVQIAESSRLEGFGFLCNDREWRRSHRDLRSPLRLVAPGLRRRLFRQGEFICTNPREACQIPDNPGAPDHVQTLFSRCAEDACNGHIRATQTSIST